MMKLLTLSKADIEKLYAERMTKDFPKDELKPLKMIFAAMDRGEYECLGLYDGDDILGYIFLVKHGNDYLIDYFAVDSQHRNEGIGGKSLQILSEYLVDADTVILEIENPDFAENEEQREIQSRRQGFYLRNGLEKTGVTVKCFGVPFAILEMVVNERHSDDVIGEIYRMHYRKLLPDKMYRDNIFVN